MARVSGLRCGDVELIDGKLSTHPSELPPGRTVTAAINISSPEPYNKQRDVNYKMSLLTVGN